MEKWIRSLSKTTALLLGIAVVVVLIVFGIVFTNLFSGLIPIIILGAFLGGGVGLAVPLLMKGVTGQTPQEKKESLTKIE